MRKNDAKQSSNDLKQKAEKENETQSDQSDSQNQNSQQLQQQKSVKFTSINKLSTYLQFFCQTKNSLLATPGIQVERQVELITSFETALQNLQINIKQTQNFKEGTDQVLLSKNQYQTFVDFQSSFKIQIENQILSKGRFTKSTRFTKQLVIHDFISSKSHEILKIKVQLMWYETQICILNELANNPFYNYFQSAGSGSFGNVYFTKIFEDFLAIKCIQIGKLQENRKNKEFDHQKIQKFFLILKNALTELFFVLLFSEIQIGPQAKTIGGFDMVVYQDSIAFATEICSQSRFNQNTSDLKTSLFCMHMLQIVHRDIKPANIMYSATYKKNVFIDFGCTQVLDDKIGKKSATHFVGTTAFCSEEVLALLTDKKKTVDLYFNDMYGLKKCINELKSSCILIEEPFQNISEIHEVEMISLKHSLYLQNYEKFISEWKLLRKKYPQNFQEMQRSLLYFFKDLKPNEFLRKFYWEEIHQDIKEQPEFKDLEVALKNEHSTLLFYLDIDQSKIDAFQMRKILFKKLKIELSDLTPKQKKIELCLIHRVTIQNEISFLLSQINNCDFKSKEMWIKIRENFEELCIIVCGYSSILQNSYGISNEQKIKICSQVMRIVEKMQDPSLNNFQIVFKCPIQLFGPMSQFYQYFLFKIFPKISQRWRQKTMIKSLSNLFLLGYPLNNSFDASYLIHHLAFLGLPVQSLSEISDDERISRINNFWECKNCLLLFYNMQYTKSSNCQIIQNTKEKQKKFKLDILKLMTPTKTEKSPFFDLNFRFFNSFAACLDIFNQAMFKDLIQILMLPELQKMSSSNKLIKKWKMIQTFSASYFSTIFQLKIQHLAIKLLQKQKIFQFSGNNEIIPFLIFFCLNRMMGIKLQFHHIFKKIDEIISYNEISFRFELKIRYQVSIGRFDFKRIQKVVKFITNDYSADQASKESIHFMKGILSILYNFLSQYLKRLTNLNEQLVNLLDICYPIVDLGAKIVIRYFEGQKHKKFISSLVLQKKGSIEIRLDQVEIEIKERQLIKQSIQQLILICQIYKKIDGIIKENYLLSFKYDQKEDIKILTTNNRYKKGIIPESHSLLIQQLKKDITLLHGPDQWFQVLSTSKYFRLEVRKHRNIAVKMAQIIKQGCRNKQQIYMHHEIIKELFDEIQLEKFDQLGDTSNLPTFDIVYQYILIQLAKSDYGLHWCTQMVKLFQTCWEKRYIVVLIDQYKSLRYFFNCFVYLNSNFKEIKSFFSRVSLFLKQSPENKYIQNINHVFFDMFWCNCINCFPRKPQNWDHYAFSKYLSQTINEEKEIQNPYMSMVYYYAMKKKTLDTDVIRRFVISILKSMNHVVFSVREIIMQDLLFSVIYSIYGSKIQHNDFVRFNPSANSLMKQFKLKVNDGKILFVEKSFENFVLQLSKLNCESCFINEANLRKITRKQRKRSSNQRLLYYYGKMIKNNSYQDESLESILKKRFFKEEFIDNYYYPSFVKQAYLRKMKRYHELKQNYQQTGNFLEFSKYSQYKLVYL